MTISKPIISIDCPRCADGKMERKNVWAFSEVPRLCGWIAILVGGGGMAMNAITWIAAPGVADIAGDLSGWMPFAFHLIALVLGVLLQTTRAVWRCPECYSVVDRSV